MTKHDEIAEVLTNEILEARFRPGERLPSERDLAARFNANRGAVREAMKKVAQMGLASIQPGGARVEPLQNASLDVIGCLLQRGQTPSANLVAQILEVMSSLVQVAADHVIADADDVAIEKIRRLIVPLLRNNLTPDDRAVARLELMHSIMLTSEQLVCQLIARALFEQLMPNVADSQPTPPPRNLAAHQECLRLLDDALATRDRELARNAFREMEELNRAEVFAFLSEDQPDNQDPSVIEVSLS